VSLALQMAAATDLTSGPSDDCAFICAGSVGTQIGIFHVVFADWSKLTHDEKDESGIESPPLHCAGYKWSLEVHPNSSKAKNYLEPEPLDQVGVFLNLKGPSALRIKVEAFVSLVRQQGDQIGHTLRLEALLDGNTGRGWRTFVPQAKLKDPTEGFKVQDTVKFTVTISVKYVVRRDLLSPALVTSRPRPPGLEDDLLSLLNDGCGADVELVFGAEKLCAHRALLMARSEVFRAMFQQEQLKEAALGSVEIPDMDLLTARAMLHYIYSNSLPEQALESMSQSLLIAADKYKINSLQLVCEKHLVATLSSSNAARRISLAHAHCCGLLKQECLDFMKDNISDVMKSEDWATHLAGKAELLNEVLAHIAGVSLVSAPSGSAKRQRLE